MNVAFFVALHCLQRHPQSLRNGTFSLHCTKMSDVVNIIAAFTALNEIDEIDMEAMFTTYLNTVVELLDAARQIREPPRPLPPLIIFNLDDQNVWSNHMIRVGFRFYIISFAFINEIAQIPHCSGHPSRLQRITLADTMGHRKWWQSPGN